MHAGEVTVKTSSCVSRDATTAAEGTEALSEEVSVLCMQAVSGDLEEKMRDILADAATAAAEGTKALSDEVSALCMQVRL